MVKILTQTAIFGKKDLELFWGNFQFEIPMLMLSPILMWMIQMLMWMIMRMLMLMPRLTLITNTDNTTLLISEKS